MTMCDGNTSRVEAAAMAAGAALDALENASPSNHTTPQEKTPPRQTHNVFSRTLRRIWREGGLHE